MVWVSRVEETRWRDTNGGIKASSYTRKYIHTPSDKNGRTHTWRDIHTAIHTEGHLRKDTDNTLHGRTQELHTEYTPHDAIHTKTNREVYTRMEANRGINTEGHTPIKIYEGQTPRATPRGTHREGHRELYTSYYPRRNTHGWSYMKRYTRKDRHLGIYCHTVTQRRIHKEG